jgi:dihydrofolate reductase
MSARAFADISMSLDGFIAGPNDDVDRLHQWIYDLASWRRAHGLPAGHTGADDDLMDEAVERSGAVVMGRRMFDLGSGPWGDEPPFHRPVFVLTHEAREPLVRGETTFTFVTEGIEKALEQASAAAGEKDVSIAGGAQVIQEALKAGRLDEIQVHVVAVLIGAGIRLFEDLGTGPIELECTRVVESPGVVHLRFDAVK